MYVFTHLLHHGKDAIQGQFLSGLKLVWIQSFSFTSTGCQTMAKEPNPLNYLPIAGGREEMDGFMLSKELEHHHWCSLVLYTGHCIFCLVLFVLFNGISTSNRLFKAKIWFICKRLIIIITIIFNWNL